MNANDPETKRIIKKAKNEKCALCGQAGYVLICFPPKNPAFFNAKKDQAVCCVLCESCRDKKNQIDYIEQHLILNGRPADAQEVLDGQIQRRGQN